MKTKIERWDENYPENADVEYASDGELFAMAREATDADIPFACLHDLAWRHGQEWNEDEELYKAYNRLNAVLNEMDRYEYPYELDEKIMGASNEELLKWAEGADTWSEFSLGCLHEIAWRNDYGWHAMNEYMEEEDGDEAFARIKDLLKKEKAKKLWYACMTDREDTDWGTGTFDRAEAEQWLRGQDGDEAYIAAIDGGYDENGDATTDPICVEEIKKGDL